MSKTERRSADRFAAFVFDLMESLNVWNACIPVVDDDA